MSPNHSMFQSKTRRLSAPLRAGPPGRQKRPAHGYDISDMQPTPQWTPGRVKSPQAPQSAAAAGAAAPQSDIQQAPQKNFALSALENVKPGSDPAANFAGGQQQAVAKQYAQMQTPRRGQQGQQAMTPSPQIPQAQGQQAGYGQQAGGQPYQAGTGSAAQDPYVAALAALGGQKFPQQAMGGQPDPSGQQAGGAPAPPPGGMVGNDEGNVPDPSGPPTPDNSLPQPNVPITPEQILALGKLGKSADWWKSVDELLDDDDPPGIHLPGVYDVAPVAPYPTGYVDPATGAVVIGTNERGLVGWDTDGDGVVDHWGDPPAVGASQSATAPPTDPYPSALDQALLDAILGLGDFGMGQEAQDAQWNLLQKQGSQAKSSLSQQMGARGMGASGLAGAGFGAIDSATMSAMQDWIISNEQLGIEERIGMLNALGNLKGQMVDSENWEKMFDYQKDEQDESDSITMINNFMGFKQGDSWATSALSKAGEMLANGTPWWEVASHLQKGANGVITWSDPPPGDGQPPTQSGDGDFESMSTQEKSDWFYGYLQDVAGAEAGANYWKGKLFDGDTLHSWEWLQKNLPASDMGALNDIRKHFAANGIPDPWGSQAELTFEAGNDTWYSSGKYTDLSTDEKQDLISQWEEQNGGKVYDDISGFLAWLSGLGFDAPDMP
jgi:hypothetical protein